MAIATVEDLPNEHNSNPGGYTKQRAIVLTVVVPPNLMGMLEFDVEWITSYNTEYGVMWTKKAVSSSLQLRDVKG